METNRKRATIGLLIGVFLSSIDSTVVTTAMPGVVGELQGVALYGWVISAYLFAFTVATPIAGRLGDTIGRKPVYITGSLVFMLASAISGLSQSIEMLIAFRALQGAAGGTLYAMTATMMGDMYPLEQRARVQALNSAVWGLSSIAGPLIGGLFVEMQAWRWIFYLNLPFGAASLAIFLSAFHEPPPPRVRSLDWAGAVLFSGTVLATLFAMPHAKGATISWTWREGAMLALAAMLALGFVANMRRGHPFPFLPFSLFRSRVVAIASLTGALVSGLMFSALTFIPLFVQGAMGAPATTAGTVITPMALGWPVAAVIASRLILTIGYRSVIVLGAACLVGAMSLLMLLTRSSSVAVPVVAMLLLGLGMGFTVTPFVVSVQSAVGWSNRGTATALSTFARSLGGTFLVAILSTSMTIGLAGELASQPEGIAVANKLLNSIERRQLTPEALAPLRAAVETSLTPIFLGMLGVALLALFTSFLFPRGTAREVTPEIAEHAHGRS